MENADKSLSVLNRSVRPRPPRNRVENRRVAGRGFVPTLTPVNPAYLMAEDVTAITATLPLTINRPSLERKLQDVAGSYLRRRAQPEPSRNEAGFQLAMVAHLEWKRRQPGANSPELEQSILLAIGQMNFLAACSLWGAMDRQGIPPNKLNAYLRSADVDWALVGDAAADAWGRQKGGDYSDGILSAAVMDLVSVYETETDSKATWSATPVGPIGTDTQRQIVGSQCGRFVLAFFERVDRAVESTKSSNALRTYLSIRRAYQTR